MNIKNLNKAIETGFRLVRKIQSEIIPLDFYRKNFIIEIEVNMDIVIEPTFPGCPWGGFRPPTIKFCEENLCSYVSQPANSFSNIGFIVVGLYILYQNRLDKNSRLNMFGYASILLGVSSFLYHASFSFLMEFFDLSSMYLLTGLMISLNINRIIPISKIFMYSVYGFIMFVSMTLLYNFKPYGIMIFTLHIVTLLFTELYLYFKNKEIVYFNYYIAIGLFVLAYIVWLLDLFRIVCYPNNHFIQGHAIWHFLTAFSSLYLYRFYRNLR
ncbi:MAG: ceramidase domain-containing protein [Leptospiraceae bacterium]|nr:ceramidase domain-containing protein [Leptospiraceae bacterium]